MAMGRIRWLSVAVLFAAVALLWQRATQPPISFVPIATFTPRNVVIERPFWAGVFRYNIETADGNKWQWTVRLRDRGKHVWFALGQGFFDFDGDGYEEFFVAKPFEALWVFKRRESVKGEKLPEQKLPSWFPLPKRQWVLWCKEQTQVGSHFEWIFVTEPDRRQPRKVIAWDAWTNSYLVLSHDGQRFICFTKGERTRMLRRGVEDVEDLDLDGICELILQSSLLGAKAIYKWDGKTYRLWQILEAQDGFLGDSILCDLDGDGTKEVVTLWGLLSSETLTYGKVLAVYHLERGRYRKVTQLCLPEGAWFLWNYNIAPAIPVSKGAIVTLKFNPPEWRRFVRNRLPSPFRRWWEEWFCRERYETWWLVRDGKNVRVKNRWSGMMLSGVWGMSGKVVWFDLERKSYHIVIASVNRRCYPVWQGKASELLSGDWDGDGDDELIVCNWEKDKGKFTVFKVQWRERR